MLLSECLWEHKNTEGCSSNIEAMDGLWLPVGYKFEFLVTVPDVSCLLLS